MEKRTAVVGRNGSLRVEFGGQSYRSPSGTKVGEGQVRVRRSGSRLLVQQGSRTERFHACNPVVAG